MPESESGGIFLESQRICNTLHSRYVFLPPFIFHQSSSIYHPSIFTHVNVESGGYLSWSWKSKDLHSHNVYFYHIAIHLQLCKGAKYVRNQTRLVVAKDGGEIQWKYVVRSHNSEYMVRAAQIYLLLEMQFSLNKQQWVQCCIGLPRKREESHPREHLPPTIATTFWG